MLGVGDSAPDFTLSAADGRPITLSQFRGKNVVLYFYPKANSLGCTIETREFQRTLPEFASKNAVVLGISVDPVGEQQRFSQRCALDFPLLADDRKEVARRYGVLGLLGFSRRVTFVLDAGGKIVAIIESSRPKEHIRRALEIAGASPPPQPP
ncbi:MAG: peroxiredoxin [Thermoplasmata archaeon]|jgi:peroxiredoxin Q/BCP